MEVSFKGNFTVRDSEFHIRSYSNSCTRRLPAMLTRDLQKDFRVTYFNKRKRAEQMESY